MRARRFLALTAALSLLFAAGSAAASATPPVQLSKSYLFDQAGVLSDSEFAAAETRLQQLADETSADLYVVFVDAFTDPSDAEAWANETASANDLGPNQ